MPQFDVYRSPNPQRFPLLLDIQAELISRLSSRVVVPLITLERYGARPITRLHPVARFEDVEYVLVTHELAAVPASALNQLVGSLASYRGVLIGALDLLFTGS